MFYYFNQYGYEEELEVVVNKSQASFISGQGKINWIKLKEIYGELNFRIISDDSIPIHTIKIISKNTTHSINVMR